MLSFKLSLAFLKSLSLNSNGAGRKDFDQSGQNNTLPRSYESPQGHHMSTGAQFLAAFSAKRPADAVPIQFIGMARQ